MKINLTKIKCSHLKPGDLFTYLDEWHWKHFLRDKEAVGLKVFIRTENECVSHDYDPNDFIFLITIDKENIQ